MPLGDSRAGRPAADGASTRRTAASGPAGISTQDQLRALAHPIRLQMLSLLTGEPQSAADLTRALHITHANASYHLRLLARAGQVELVEVERVRGGRARRYRYVGTDDTAVAKRTAKPTGQPTRRTDRLLVYTALAEELRRRAGSAEPSGEQTLTDAELWVDDPAWRDFVQVVRGASPDLHAAARAPQTPGTRRVSATIALFRLADEPTPGRVATTRLDARPSEGR